MHDITAVKPLTNDSYYKAKETARERAMEEAGRKPSRSDYEEEFDKIWRGEDAPLLIVLLSSFVLSAIHVFSYTGEIAGRVYSQHGEWVGLFLSRDAFVIAHQVGFTLLAEFSILSFMVLIGLNPRIEREGRVYDNLGRMRRGIFLALTGAAIVFTIVANTASGLPLFVSLLVPAITVGGGFYIERKIVENVARRRKISRRFTDDLREWETTRRNPEESSNFSRYFAESLLENLLRLKQNREWAERNFGNKGDIPTPVKLMMVRREMARESWAEGVGDFTPEEGDALLPVESREGSLSREDDGERLLSNGSTAEELSEEIINNGWYQNGKFLRTYSDLQEMYGVGNNTIAKARKLVEEKYA